MLADGGHMEISRPRQRAIVVLVGTQLLIMLGIGLIIPVEPYIKADLNLTSTDMGIMMALFAFVQFVASPIIGRLSDRFARKPLIAAGLLIYALGEFMFAAGTQLWHLDVARAIGGLSAALAMPTTQALAADMTTPANRAKVVGWLSAALSGGLILGPGIGGVLASIDHKLPFWAAGVLGLLSFIAFLIWMPREADLVVTRDEQMAREAHTTGWPLALILLLGMILVSSFGLTAFESMFSLYFHDVRGFDLAEIAWFLIINGVASLIFQVVLFDRMVRTVGELRVIRYSFFASMLAVGWILFAGQKWEVFIATLIVFVGFDVLRPAITTLLAKVSEGRQGLMNGLNLSLTSIGNVVGPIVGGLLLDASPVLPYSFVAVILLIAGGLTWFIRFDAR